MNSTLHDYTNVEPLVVREIKPVRAPRGGEILGFIGPSNRDENCIVCQETRGVQKDGSQNFYRKLGGYSFDESAINKLLNSKITRIVIDELDTESVFEFDVTQFNEDGGVVDGIQQLGVPLKDAMYEWDSSETNIMRASSR